MRKKHLIAPAALLALGALAGCSSDADVVNQNMTKDADNFKIERHIRAINGITDVVLLDVEGRCSLNDQGSQLEVICKVGDDTYKKHLIGLSDNVSYVSEQVDPIASDPYHYKFVLKPEQVIPNFDVNTSGGAS